MKRWETLGSFNSAGWILWNTKSASSLLSVAAVFVPSRYLSQTGILSSGYFVKVFSSSNCSVTVWKEASLPATCSWFWLVEYKLRSASDDNKCLMFISQISEQSGDLGLVWCRPLWNKLQATIITLLANDRAPIRSLGPPLLSISHGSSRRVPQAMQASVCHWTSWLLSFAIVLAS